METTTRPVQRSLGAHGSIQGLTISANSRELCHYFGGIRYALPPIQRWRRARRLPTLFSYGTPQVPGQCDNGASVCPQPVFIDLAPGNPDIWDEDCFQSNIWIPMGHPPKGGWPVFVFIHGGWLQLGTPNGFNAGALLSETDFRAVIVMPAYRVNLFGFLYSSEMAQDAAAVDETVGNHGFWDQRLALEWTKQYIHLFGGNPDKITISGYSAGAHSVFHQLAYDLRQPDDQIIVRQAIMFSNSPGVQPKRPAETQIQFNQLLAALSIPQTLSGSEKLARLRALPSKTLLDAAKTIEVHQFHPTTDGNFVIPSLFSSLDSGEFAAKFVSRNIRVILGECSDESHLYATWFPPKNNTLSALRTRLIADYPAHIVDTVLSLHYPTGQLPAGCTDWTKDAWGRIYADMQVYQMQRGLIHALTTNKAGVNAEHLLYRYRIEFRASCMDAKMPAEWGVTHSSDYPLWFWGNGDTLTESEKKVTHKAFIGPLARFVQNTRENGFGWGTNGIGVRTMKADGTVEITQDRQWDEGVRAWKAVRAADIAQEKLQSPTA